MSWTITSDIPMTRRLRIHELRNEKGEIVSQHQRFSEAIRFAYERDIRRLELITPDGHFLIDVDEFPF